MRTRDALRECRSAVSGKDSQQKSPWTAVPDGGSDRRMLLPPATRGAYAQGFGVYFATLAGEMPCLFFCYALGGFFLP